MPEQPRETRVPDRAAAAALSAFIASPESSMADAMREAIEAALPHLPGCGQCGRAQDEYESIEAERNALAAGLRGLASMVDEYLSDAHRHEDGSVSEPDESDPVCHLWNAASAANDDPAEIGIWLYAEHGPGEDDKDERDLIHAGLVLAKLSDPRRDPRA